MMKRLRGNIQYYFKLWTRYLRQRQADNERYRLTFWPFYVWKRYRRQMIQARDKAAFLQRVYHTACLISHWKLWRKWRQLQSHYRELILLNIHRRDEKLQAQIFSKLMAYSIQLKKLRLVRVWESIVPTSVGYMHKSHALFVNANLVDRPGRIKGNICSDMLSRRWLKTACIYGAIRWF